MKLSAWRLVKTRYLATAWDGEGARKVGGRWNTAGVPVVYVSGSLSLALTEVLVHLPGGAPLNFYSAVSIEFDEELVTAIQLGQLPSDWKVFPAPVDTKAIGDSWVAGGRTAILRVPSVVVPMESNFLLNPRHPDFKRIRISRALPFPFDPRLLKR